MSALVMQHINLTCHYTDTIVPLSIQVNQMEHFFANDDKIIYHSYCKRPAQHFRDVQSLSCRRKREMVGEVHEPADTPARLD